MRHLAYALLLFTLSAQAQVTVPLGSSNPANTNRILGKLKVDSLVILPNLATGSTRSVFIDASGRMFTKDTTIASGASGLQATLDAGNTANGQKIKLTNDNPSDSFMIDIDGHGRYKGIRIKNNADTSSSNALNVAGLKVENSYGKGWMLRAYSPGATSGYAVLFSDADSAFGLQGNGTNDLILWKNVGHGYDAYAIFKHQKKSLNLSNDLFDHMDYSNHLHNFYVDGNTMLNNPVTLNDTGRGYTCLYLGSYQGNKVPIGPVGLKIITLKKDSTQNESFYVNGEGETYIKNSLRVGDIDHNTGNPGIVSVYNDNAPNTKPLIYLDRVTNNNNYMECWRYFQTRIGYIDNNAKLHFPNYYITNPGTTSRTDSSLTIDANTREVVMTANPDPNAKLDTGTNGYIKNQTSMAQTGGFNVSGQAFIGDKLTISNGTTAPTGINVTGSNRRLNIFSDGNTNAINLGSFCSGPTNAINTYISRGVALLPIAIQLTDLFFSVAMNGHDGNGYASGGLMQWYAAENWSSTGSHHATNFDFRAISNVSNSSLDRISYKGLFDAIYFAQGAPSRVSVGRIATSRPSARFEVVGDSIGDTAVYINALIGQAAPLQAWAIGNVVKSAVDSSGNAVFPKYYLLNPGTSNRTDSFLTRNVSSGELVMAAAPSSTSYEIISNKATDFTTKNNTLYPSIKAVDDYAAAIYSALGHAHSFASITSKPATLSGYGITDAQTLNTHLTTISSLSPANDDLLQYKAGAWINRTIAQLKTDLSLSGTNTGDQVSVTGNAGTATALQTARTIGGTSFDGTVNITVASATGGFTVSGGNLALGSNSLTTTGSIAATGSRVTKGWFTDIESTNVPTVGGVALPTASSTTTFTNKTLTSPVISSISNTGTIAVPTVTSTLVGYVLTTTASSSAPAPTGDARDNRLTVTALATAPTFAAPSGTAADGNTLLIRVKDNGTARALTWNAIYRAGTVLALPTTTTISKTIYVQFVYNSADSKWDLIGLTDGI